MIRPDENFDTIGVLIALKPQGRQFIEVSLGNTKPLASARFDLQEAAFLGGKGPRNAAALVQVTDSGWRLCCIRLPFSGPAAATELRLALASSADFALDYKGEARRGVLASDPVAIKV